VLIVCYIIVVFLQFSISVVINVGLLTACIVYIMLSYYVYCGVIVCLYFVYVVHILA